MTVTDSQCNSSITILFVIILLVSSINCDTHTNEQKYYTHPNSYIVDQLLHKKIIMLGDFRHGYPLPYKSLISLLNKWYDKVKSGESKSNNIVLVLEADTQEVRKLNEFVSTGEWKPFVDYWLPYNTVEWLEFCADLRSLKLQIDSLNENQDFKPGISFSLYGGETGNIFDNPQFLHLSKKEGSKYFVNIRDSLTSKNVIGYLKKNTNRKAIIFYGNLHLIKNYVNKNIAAALLDSESYGYYLALYLMEEFGKDSVLSINQWHVSDQMIKNSQFAAAKDSNIFVYSEDIPWSSLHPENFDGYILRHERPSPGHNLAYVFSKNIINADIERMQFIVKYLPGYLAERYYGEAEESLKLLTGHNFNNLNEWKDWISKNNFDGFSRLNSKKFEKDIFNEYYGNPADSKVKIKLLELGFGPGIMRSQLIPRTKWEGVWRAILPQIKYLNAIGLLWVGTSEEKQKAKAYLTSIIGEVKAVEMQGPQDYLKLYRKYFCNVNW